MTSREVVLATHNQGKVVELREILGSALGEGVELVGYDGPEKMKTPRRGDGSHRRSCLPGLVTTSSGPDT